MVYHAFLIWFAIVSGVVSSYFLPLAFFQARRQSFQSCSVTFSIAFAGLCSQRSFLLAKSRFKAGIALSLPR